MTSHAHHSLSQSRSRVFFCKSSHTPAGVDESRVAAECASTSRAGRSRHTWPSACTAAVCTASGCPRPDASKVRSAPRHCPTPAQGLLSKAGLGLEGDTPLLCRRRADAHRVRAVLPECAARRHLVRWPCRPAQSRTSAADAALHHCQQHKHTAMPCEPPCPPGMWQHPRSIAAMAASCACSERAGQSSPLAVSFVPRFLHTVTPLCCHIDKCNIDRRQVHGLSVMDVPCAASTAGDPSAVPVWSPKTISSIAGSGVQAANVKLTTAASQEPSPPHWSGPHLDVP